MVRKAKISSAVKIRYVKRFIAREISKSEAARECGVCERTFEVWVAKYKADGPKGLQAQKQQQSHPSPSDITEPPAFAMQGRFCMLLVLICLVR